VVYGGILSYVISFIDISLYFQLCDSTQYTIYIESVIYCTYHICFPCINKTASKKRLLTFKISVFQKKRSTFFSHEKHVNQHPQHSHIWRLIRVLFVRVFSALPRLSFFFFFAAGHPCWLLGVKVPGRGLKTQKEKNRRFMS